MRGKRGPRVRKRIGLLLQCAGAADLDHCILALGKLHHFRKIGKGLARRIFLPIRGSTYCSTPAKLRFRAAIPDGLSFAPSGPNEGGSNVTQGGLRFTQHGEDQMSELREVMSQVSLEDLQVGPDGRVHIANPDVAARLSAIKSAATTTPTNGSGCNGHHCGRQLE